MFESALGLKQRLEIALEAADTMIEACLAQGASYDLIEQPTLFIVGGTDYDQAPPKSVS